MFTSRSDFEIRWGDCDPAGIVFYPRYFEYFDAATAGLFAGALGRRKSDWTERYGVVGIPMVDTRARFILPSRHGDRVEIETEIVEIRRSSFDVLHRLTKDGKLAVEGFETRVWTGRDPVDETRIRSVEIPEEVRRKLSARAR